MYKNVSSDTVTIKKEEYDNLIRERDEYRNVALDLGELCRQLRGDSA